MQVAFGLVYKIDSLSCKCGKQMLKLKALINTTPGLTYIAVEDI